LSDLNLEFIYQNSNHFIKKKREEDSNVVVIVIDGVLIELGVIYA